MLVTKKSLVKAIIAVVIASSAASSAQAGDSYIEATALNGSTVQLESNNVGDARSVLIGGADARGIVRGKMNTFGVNGGQAEQRMVLQSMGGFTDGVSHVQANGPFSSSSSELYGGSFQGTTVIRNRGTAGPFGSTNIKGRALTQFGHGNLVLDGHSAGYNGGMGQVQIEGLTQSFGPFSNTTINATGMGMGIGGNGFVYANGTAIGQNQSAGSSIHANALGNNGNAAIFADDFTQN